MAGSETIGVDLVIRLDQLKAQLAGLAPGMEKEAKAMVASLEKELKKAEKVTDKSAAQMNRIWAQVDRERAKGTGFSVFAGQVDNVGVSASKAAKALGPLGGVLARISPEAGAISASVAGATSALEGFGAAGLALGPLAIAVGVVAAGYVVMAREAEEAAARVALLTAEGDKQAAAWRSLADAQLALDVAEGRVTEGQAAILRASQSTQDALDGLTDSYGKQVKEAELAAASAETWAARVSFLGPLLGPVVDVVAGFTSTAEAQRVVVDDLNASLETQSVLVVEAGNAQQEATRILEERRAAEERARKATEAHAAAIRRVTEADRQYLENQAASVAMSARGTDAVAKLVAMTDESADAQLEGEAALAEAYQERLTLIGQITAAGIMAGQGENAAAAGQQAALAAEAKYLADLDALRDEAATKEAERIKALAELQTEEIRRRMEEINTYVQGVNDVFSEAASFASDVMTREYERRADIAADLQAYLEDNEDTLTEKQKAALEERIAAQEEKAREAFAINQGVAMVGAIVNTAAAVVNALATVPYPAAPFVAAAAGIAGMAEVATIAATEPSFHTGGGVTGGGMYPDERRVRALTGETVVDRVSTASAGGPEGVRAAIQGGSDNRPIFRIGRIESREIIRTDIRSGGLIPQETRKLVSRGGRRVGISGRSVIA